MMVEIVGQFLYMSARCSGHVNHSSAVYSRRNSSIPADNKIKLDALCLAVRTVILKTGSKKSVFRFYSP